MSSLHLAGEGAGCLLPSDYSHPPSICAKAPLRRRHHSGASFWTTRCCCPLARPLSAKNPAGSVWSSQTRRTGSAWVSSLLPQPSSVQHPLGPQLQTPAGPMLTAPHFFSGMQRMRQVLERQSQMIEDVSLCHNQEPHSQSG